jgi:MFS family permease
MLSFPLATETGWRYLFAFTCIPAIIQLVLSRWLIESPRLLLMKGKHDQACVALRVLRNTPDVEDEVAAIVNASRNEVPAKAGGVLSNLDNPRVVYGLLVGCGLHLAQQLSGINAVFYYSTSFFSGLGLSDPRLGTIMVGVVNVLATVAAIFLMDKFGRRPLLLASVGGMFISSLVVTWATVSSEALINSGAAAEEQSSEIAKYNTIAVAAITLFVAMFEIGLGPGMCYVYVSVCDY